MQLNIEFITSSKQNGEINVVVAGRHLGTLLQEHKVYFFLDSSAVHNKTHAGNTLEEAKKHVKSLYLINVRQ